MFHPPDEALGRSRSGLTSKIHISCDGKGRPLSASQDTPRPELLADRGYSYSSCRELLRSRNIRHVIPERTDQRRRRASRPGRKPQFDREAYAWRNVVERCVNKLKQWRGIAIRYDKRALNYKAAIVIAALYMWLTT